MRSSIIHLYQYPKQGIIILSLSLVVLAALYIFAIGAAIFHTSIRTDAEGRITNLQDNLIEKESVYLGKIKEINLSLAHENGFSEVVSPTYIPLGSIPKTVGFIGLRNEN